MLSPYCHFSFNDILAESSPTSSCNSSDEAVYTRAKALSSGVKWFSLECGMENTLGLQNAIYDVTLSYEEGTYIGIFSISSTLVLKARVLSSSPELKPTHYFYHNN